jgi:hypothetical protein
MIYIYNKCTISLLKKKKNYVIHPKLLTCDNICLKSEKKEEEKRRKKDYRERRALKAMESETEMVAFPLLLTPIETNYRACTIPYRFPSDNPKKATPTELQWINVFLNSIASFK